MRAASVALVVLSTVLAGCIGGDSKSSDQSTMGDLLPVAATAAKTWDPGAQFFLAVGWEQPNATTEHVNEENLTVPSDDSVGDGRGLVWLYGYFDASSSAVLFMAVSAVNNSIVFREEVGAPAQATEGALQWRANEWKVDSDKALHKAQENATFADVEAQLAQPTYGYTLVGLPAGGEGDEPAALWVVLALDLADVERIAALEEDGDLDAEEVNQYVGTINIAVAAINAVTGEVVEAGRLSDVAPPVPEDDVETPPVDPHAGHDMGPRTLYEASESGQLTIVAGTATFPLPVAESGAVIQGNFSYGGGTIPGGASMKILAADGTELYTSGGAGLTTKETRLPLFVEEVPAGDYTVQVTIDRFAVVSEWAFDLTVTATGMPMDMGNDTAGGHDHGGMRTLSLDQWLSPLAWLL